MVEPTNELILEILRRIRADISDPKADVREIRGRPSSLETRMAHMEIRFAELDLRMAELSARTDRRDEPMRRISRRLELTDHPQ